MLDENAIMKKSIESGVSMTFMEFVKFNNIDLDSIKVDKLFHNLNNNIPILMDKTMISYFGYASEMKEETPKQIRLKKLRQNLC